jgi:hypothetical protein
VVKPSVRKRKMLDFGMRVERLTTRGTWSEVARVMEVSVEFGKAVLMAALRKTRSRRARVGSSRLFDQVKSRSNRGSSRRWRESIVLLN